MPKHPIYTYIKQLSIVHLKFRFPWDILHFIWQPYQGTVLSWTNSLVPLGGRTCPGRVSGPGKLSALGLLVPTAPGFGRGPPPIPSPITNVDDRKSQSDMEFQITQVLPWFKLQPSTTIAPYQEAHLLCL